MQISFALMARTFYPARVGELQRRRDAERMECITPHTLHLEVPRFGALHSLAPPRNPQAHGSDQVLAALSGVYRQQAGAEVFGD